MKNKYRKGFCPTLKKPIRASDGLLVRIRPYMDVIESDNLIFLCNLAEKYGSGIMELTNRGSLQIRGIKDIYHQNFVKEILRKEFINKTVKNYLNILINPFWEHKDKNFKIYNILAKLKISDLPPKFAITIDLGKSSYLRDIYADIRIENSDNKKILVRAEGSSRGKIVKLEDVESFVLEIIKWFLNNKKQNTNKMSELLLKKKLPKEWCQTEPLNKCDKIFPSNNKLGQILGVKLGRFTANNLKKLLLKCSTPRVRLTPHKMIILEKVRNITDENFIIKKNDPFLSLSACSGKNFCVNSTLNTFDLANKIKDLTNLNVHIAGCEKNCGITKQTQILLSDNKKSINVFDLRKKKILNKKNINDFSKEFFKDIEKI